MPRKAKPKPPPVAPDWTTACPDWQQRIVARQSLIPFAPLFPAEAKAAEEVFSELRIVDAPHSPTMAKAALPWVFDFMRTIFGSYDASTGRRLIREYFLLIAKKNSKSTTAAAIMLTALVRNWRQSAEFLILAPTLEIANNAFGPCADMVRASPDLNAIMKVRDHVRTIIHTQTNAHLKVVAADSEAVGGKKAVGVLVDELWIFGKRVGAENMMREATGGMASRPEGFTIYLSTQSDEPPAGIFRQLLVYARGVRDGRIQDKRFLPVLYEFPAQMAENGDFRDKANFYLTNPNLGASVDQEYLEREYDKAKQGGQSSLIGFFAKYLNIEVGIALKNDSWPGAEFWREAVDKSLTLDVMLERCEAIVVGIDGGGLDDLFGLSVLGREQGGERWLSWSHAWCHKGVLQRRVSIASALETFAGDGELTIVDDRLDDLTAIVEIIQRIDEAGLLVCVAIDSEGPFGELVDALAGIEITETNKKVVGVGQGYKLMAAIKTAERKLANGTLVHAPSRMMDWCVSNVKIEATATAIRATKQNAGDAKIDPWCALMDAATVMVRHPEANAAPDYQITFA